MITRLRETLRMVSCFLSISLLIAMLGACSGNMQGASDLTMNNDANVQPTFYTSNLSASEAGRIAKRILQKQNFTIEQAIGREPAQYILGKNFSVMYNNKKIDFRGIDFFYGNYRNVIIYGAQIPNNPSYFRSAGSLVQKVDEYEYNPSTGLRALVGARYYFNTSLPFNRDLRTCVVVLEARSIDDFEAIIGL